MNRLVKILEKENRNSSVETLVKALYMEEEYVKNFIKESMPDLKIEKVEKVNNNFLEGMYCLSKEELQVRRPEVTLTEKNLLHVTSQENVQNIISNNLGWRYTVRGSYGKGVYFSNRANLADSLCNPNCGTKRAFIICKVIVGSQRVIESAWTVPPQGVDTGVCHNGEIFVKFSDHEHLPLFVAFYGT